MKNYPLLDVRVSTPTLELRSATDELLDRLADLVRAGKTHAEPPPDDAPMSFYTTDPDVDFSALGLVPCPDGMAYL